MAGGSTNLNPKTLGRRTADVLGSKCQLKAIKTSGTVHYLNSVQTLTLVSWGANDTIKLTFDGGNETVAVTNTGTQTAQSAAFQAALEGLPDFVVGDVVVTNGVDADHFVVTFGGNFGHVAVAALTATNGTGSATGTFAQTAVGATGKQVVTGIAKDDSVLFVYNVTEDDEGDAFDVKPTAADEIRVKSDTAFGDTLVVGYLHRATNN